MFSTNYDRHMRNFIETVSINVNGGFSLRNYTEV